MTSAKVGAGAAVAVLGMSVWGMVFASPAEAGQVGRASWYKMGTMTASGERMDPQALAAAHRTLPFGTRVRVENLGNGQVVEVRINDRGPFTGGRVIDVTQAAAERLGMIRAGVADVRLSVLD